MRVLLVSEMYPPNVGGLEVHVASLAEHLSNRGNVVEVATLSGSGGKGGPPVREVASAVGVLRSGRHRQGAAFHPPLPDPVSAWSLRQLVSRFRPDIIHAHNWLAASVLSRGRAKLVITAHDYGLTCARRDYMWRGKTICPGPSASRCWSCSHEKMGRSGQAVAVTLPLGRGLLRPDALVAVSNAVARKMEGRFDCPTFVIPNFVDPSALRSGAGISRFVPAGPFVMYAGAVGHHKGTDLLLDIWRRNEFPDIGLFLATPGTLESDLAGVTVRKLTRDEVITAWSKARVAVVPSRWEEPCPTVVLEAMTLGVPLVASAVGGIPDLVQDGVSAMLVAPDDRQALVQALKEVTQDGDLCARLGQGAMERAKRYHAGPVVDRIEEIYRLTQDGRGPYEDRIKDRFVSY